MKKVKKNNKPIIILIVGLLVFGSLIGFSVFKMNEHKKMVYEHHENFEKEIDQLANQFELLVYRLLHLPFVSKNRHWSTLRKFPMLFL